MNAESVIAQLQADHPDGTILCLPDHGPTEIICELPQSADGGTSLAIAVIDQSAPHVHHRTTETYTVLRGAGELQLDGHRRPLEPGDVVVITPGQVHSVTGNEVWLHVQCTPPWTTNDHIVIATTTGAVP